MPEKKEEPLVIFHPGISIKEKLIEILKTLACVTLCCFFWYFIIISIYKNYKKEENKETI